uniref:Uncharacterized protein n=1 Tax=Molossus molossus TaxID=27622 RepID=A0A7J8HHX3_MOLMO|nr:hypothetical protein HJG59_011009 [Molossus molossus]
MRLHCVTDHAWHGRGDTGGQLLIVEPHGRCRQEPQATEEVASSLPRPLTLGVGSPTPLPLAAELLPITHLCSSRAFSRPQRGESLCPPSRDLPIPWWNYNWSPFNGQPGHDCLPRAQVCDLLPLPLRRGEVLKHPTPGGHGPGPHREWFTLPHLISLDSLGGRKM